MKIELHEVISSNISKIGYDAESQTLYIRFKGGSLWKYWPVPAKKYQEFSEASSVGQYFARNIRANMQFEAKAIEEDLEDTA
jgi:hypothetical protein